MDLERFENRKRDHLREALKAEHQAVSERDLERYRLIHDALPDFDLSDVDLSAPFLDRSLKTPFFVAGMTAGHKDAFALNRRIAVACQSRGWAMGVGSQRRDLEAGENLAQGTIDQWKSFRQESPSLVLFANIGISQIISGNLDRIRQMMDLMEADLLMVHLNALQEALQPEGTPNFKGSWKALESLVRQLGRPVAVKETGCGISRDTAGRLTQLGVAAIDVSGLGGTHWGRIEGARAEPGSIRGLTAATFANWGIPTARSVSEAAQVGGLTEIWASGGVRTGLDSAKLIALGASRVGFAKPILDAAMESESILDQWMALREFELKVALFCTGKPTVAELRRDGPVYSEGQPS